MAYSFTNTRIKQRSVRLHLNRLKSLSEATQKAEILDALSEFGINDTSLSLPEADLKLDSAFRAEAAKLANRERTSKSLRLLAQRFEILELIDFLTNFNDAKISSKFINRPGFGDIYSSTDLNSTISKINKKYGFNLNQNSNIGELRDDLLSQYLLKLSMNTSKDVKTLIERERTLTKMSHEPDFPHSLGTQRGSWFYGILKTDLNIVDLRITLYLYKKAKALAVQDPLGEMITVYYIYNLDLAYKLLKALYFSIKKGIKLDLGRIWEV